MCQAFTLAARDVDQTFPQLRAGVTVSVSMMKIVTLILVLLTAACATEEDPRTSAPVCAELGAPDTLLCNASGFCTWQGTKCVTSATFDVAWSIGDSDSPGVPDPVECTDTISHPCPFILYTGTLVLDGASATWTNATGGVDGAGVSAEDRLPWIDEVSFDGGLTLPQRGDDGGLRRASTLQKIGNGYEGAVSWNLFTVAGTTTFEVVLTRVEH